MSAFFLQLKTIDGIISKLNDDQRKKLIEYINLKYKAEQINERLEKLVGTEMPGSFSDSEDDEEPETEMKLEDFKEVKPKKNSGKRGRPPKQKN